MTSTQDAAGVRLDRPQTAVEAAETLVGMTLSVRAKWLPKASNGYPIASRDPVAANICRDMAEGRSQEWKRLLTKKFCDQADGVPTEALVEDLHFAIAVLRARAPETRVNRQLAALTRAETKAQARFDLAQFRLAEQPDDPMAIREALDAAEHYARPFDEIRAELRHRLAMSSCARSVTVGRRNGRLVIARNDRVHVTKSATLVDA